MPIKAVRVKIYFFQSPSPKGEGTGIENCHSRSDTVLAAQGFLAEREERAWKGAQGGKVGGRAGQGIRRAVVRRLSVTGRTSPSCLGQSSRNFRWWSGSWSGTFISGTGPIGQGTGEKRAGNLNFGRFRLKDGGCFGKFYGLVWLPGGAPCNLVVPGGH